MHDMTIYMRVHPYTHTITHVCARMNIRVGPYTHVPRIYTHIYAPMHKWAPTRTHRGHMHLCTRVPMSVPLHARHIYIHTFHMQTYEYAPTRTPHATTHARTCEPLYARTTDTHLYTRVDTGRHLHACYIYVCTYACTKVRVSPYTHNTRTCAHARTSEPLHARATDI